MLSGVPQGSMLVPLLFTFVNDAPLLIKHSSLYQYADDMKLYNVVSTPHDGMLQQKDTNRIKAWCGTNYFNPAEPKTIVISFIRKSDPLFLYTLCLCTANV